jgi:hypothetical protein
LSIGSPSDFSVTSKIGIDAVSALKYCGGLGNTGKSACAALMAACTSRAALSVSRPKMKAHDDGRRAFGRIAVHFVDAGNLAQVPFQRRQHRAGHGLRAGTRLGRLHENHRQLERRQRRHAKQKIGADAGEYQAQGKQRSACRAADHGGKDIHGASLACKHSGEPLRTNTVAVDDVRAAVMCVSIIPTLCLSASRSVCALSPHPVGRQGCVLFPPLVPTPWDAAPPASVLTVQHEWLKTRGAVTQGQVPGTARLVEVVRGFVIAIEDIGQPPDLPDCGCKRLATTTTAD